MATKETSSRGKSKNSTGKTAAVRIPAEKSNGFATFDKWNFALAFVFAAQAIVILVLSKTVTLPVVTHYLTIDSLATQAAGHTVLAPAVRHLFDINLAYLVGAFLLIPAVLYLLAATIWRQHYKADLRSGINCLRTAEFALGGGLVLVTLSLITGVYDASLLLTVFSLIALGAILTHVLELCRGKIQLSSWIVNVFIFFTVLVPWLVIAMYLKGAVIYGSGLPHYVYWADGTMFVIFGATAANFYLAGRKKGRWANNTFAERMYMLLSLVSKTAVAWLIFAGALR